MRTIRAIHVSPEVMADFGRAIRVTPDVCPDAESEIQTYYGQLAIMESSDAVQIGICVAKGDRLLSPSSNTMVRRRSCFLQPEATLWYR